MIADWTVSISDGVRPVEFEVLALVQDADYSWSAEAVLRRPSDGAIFFVTDSGCSCNGFGEYLTVADLTLIRRFEDALPMTSDRARLQRSYDEKDAIYR